VPDNRGTSGEEEWAKGSSHQQGHITTRKTNTEDVEGRTETKAIPKNRNYTAGRGQKAATNKEAPANVSHRVG